MKKITLAWLAEEYALSRLAPADPIPAWADGPGFVTISRSDEELSIVCRAARVPPLIQADRGWCCLRFVGPFAFDETGIVLSVIAPLSAGGIGVFVVSTFDGDHLLIKQDVAERSSALLQAAGHRLQGPAAASAPI